MGKRKKKKQQKKKNADISTARRKPVRGFDFGCLPHAMAFGSLDFVNALSEASIVGVAYRDAWSIELNQEVPSIALIAERREPLVRAFQEFHRWAETTDPDAVELTIVFREDGSYLLALGPEWKRLERRTLGYDRAHQVIWTALIWVKPIDTTNPILRQIREYASHPISPFLLEGATYSGSQLRTPRLEPISGVNPLLKFEITFVDETDVQPNTVANVVLRTVSGEREKRRKQPYVPSLSAVAEGRKQAIRRHFPVTLERFRRQDTSELLNRLGGEEQVKMWQIEQAFCNLVLSRDLELGEHYEAVSSSKLTDAIVTGLQNRFEIADSSTPQAFSIEAIERQILADTNSLLRALRQQPAKDLASAQSLLAELSASDDTAPRKSRG